jgi:hypothetical protein
MVTATPTAPAPATRNEPAAARLVSLVASTWTTLWKFRTPIDPDHGGATSTATLWRDNLGGLVLGMDYADGERVIVLPLSDEDMDDLAAAIHEHRTMQQSDSSRAGESDV